MDTLLIMSLSSSMLLLLLITIEHFLPDLFNQKCRYHILKIALLLLIVPLPLLKECIRDILSDQFFHQEITEGFPISGAEPTIIYSYGVMYENEAYRVSMLLRNICLSITVVLLLYYVCGYIKSKKEILGTFFECVDPEALDILDKYKEKMKIRRGVRIYTANLPVSPFNIGIWKPIIVIPEFKDPSKKEMAICHELYHIKSYDGLFRFLYIVLAGAYWYNPLTYLLGAYLKSVSELSCDEAVTEHMDRGQRKRYGNLVIDMACQDSRCPNSVGLSFSGDKKNIKRRVRLIMQKKRKTSFVTMVISVFMVIFSVSSVFAYKPPNELELIPIPGEKEDAIEANETTAFILESDFLSDIGLKEVVYDFQFTDMYNNVYEVQELDGRKNCVHNYVDGKYQEHLRYADGSCKVNIYSARRCTKCKSVEKKSLQSSTTFPQCTH